MSIFEIKAFSNISSQGTKGINRGCWELKKLSMGGSETEGGSLSEEQSSGDDFASQCVHKHIIRSVDVNYHLSDNPLISSSVSFHTQAEFSQKCLVAIRYLILTTWSYFPHRLVALGLAA